VVAWLLDHPEYKSQLKIVVHSLNPRRGRLMHVILRQNGYRSIHLPLAWDDPQLVRALASSD
jgi:hypothetical protein